MTNWEVSHSPKPDTPEADLRPELANKEGDTGILTHDGVRFSAENQRGVYISTNFDRGIIRSQPPRAPLKIAPLERARRALSKSVFFVGVSFGIGRDMALFWCHVFSNPALILLRVCHKNRTPKFHLIIFIQPFSGSSSPLPLLGTTPRTARIWIGQRHRREAEVLISPFIFNVKTNTKIAF